jgi:hypothetical protein
MAETFTSGCTDTVLEVGDDGLYYADGSLIGTQLRGKLPPRVLDYAYLIAENAVRYGVPEHFIAGVMAQESRGNPNAVSPAGAVGLMQLMPQYYGGNDNNRLFDPALNVQLGVETLANKAAKYDGNPLRVLAAYNSGGAHCKATPTDRWGLRTDPGYIDGCLGWANEAAYQGFATRPYEPSVDVPPAPPAPPRRSLIPLLAFLGGGAVAVAAVWAIRRR